MRHEPTDVIQVPAPFTVADAAVDWNGISDNLVSTRVPAFSFVNACAPLLYSFGLHLFCISTSPVLDLVWRWIAALYPRVFGHPLWLARGNIGAFRFSEAHFCLRVVVLTQVCSLERSMVGGVRAGVS